MADTDTKRISTKTIGILLEMIENKDWEAFQSTALSSTETLRTIVDYISNIRQSHFNGMTLLHAVVRYDPPVKMIAAMIKICPDLPAAKDCIGRTPLHVAAGSAASPRLIKLIAHAHPPSCVVRDEDGKTPLHFACDITCELFEEDNASRDEISHDTIRALLSESLYASTIEDSCGMNALEHAILSDAAIETVGLLQIASCKCFEYLKKLSSRSVAAASDHQPLIVSFKEVESCIPLHDESESSAIRSISSRRQRLHRKRIRRSKIPYTIVIDNRCIHKKNGLSNSLR